MLLLGRIMEHQTTQLHQLLYQMELLRLMEQSHLMLRSNIPLLWLGGMHITVQYIHQ
jgi:hypothetical protein